MRDIPRHRKIKKKTPQPAIKQVDLFRSAYEKSLFHEENTSPGFIEWDNKLSIRSLSGRTEEIFGWNLPEFIESKKSGLTGVYEEDQPWVSRVAKQLLNGEVERNNIQHRNYTKDKGVIWCAWFNYVLKDKKGKVIAIMSVVHDITERRLAAGSLSKPGSDTVPIFENTADGFILTDINGILKFFTDKAKRLIFPDTEAELKIGKSIFDFIHPTKKDYYKNIVANVLGGKTLRYVYSYEGNNSEIKLLDLAISPVYSPQGIDGVCMTTFDITERKAFEATLTKEESRMLDLFENAPEAIVVLNADTGANIIRFNKSALRLLKFKPEEFSQITPGDASPPFQPDGSRSEIKAMEYINAALAGEKPVFEWMVLDACGKEFMCEVHLVRLPVMGEKHVLVSFRDITARIVAEAALLRSESNLKAIIENSDSLIYSIDRDFRYITFNEPHRNSLKEAHGLSIKPGDHIYDFLEKLNPEEARHWQNVYTQGFNGEIVKFEKEFIHGEYYGYFDFSIFPIWENKNVVGLSCFARDITKQKQAEETQQQSELRYRQIVETAQEGIWMIDENSRTIFVNKKMCDILEYPAEEMMGKDFFYFINDVDKQKAKAISGRKNSIIENIDFRFITKSGRPIWTNITANRIFDTEGNYKSALVMVSDITEKKNLHQRLLEQQLDKQKEITKAVVNAQEKERDKIGEELHDNVNQLLTASRVCLDRALSEADYAPFVLKSRDFLVNAMGDIRKLSHTLIGPTQGETLGLIDSIKDLINNVSIIKEINIAFQYCTYHEEESEVELKLIIYRIIQEQMSNILKHAEAAEVEIELKKEKKDLVLSIDDNGKGFDILAKRNGIGLINIKSRASVYHGKVQILSSPGNGCKMKIIFKNHYF